MESSLLIRLCEKTYNFNAWVLKCMLQQYFFTKNTFLNAKRFKTKGHFHGFHLWSITRRGWWGKLRDATGHAMTYLLYYVIVTRIKKMYWVFSIYFFNQHKSNLKHLLARSIIFCSKKQALLCEVIMFKLHYFMTIFSIFLLKMWWDSIKSAIHPFSPNFVSKIGDFI